uniref:Uncharacterized protein n=1 Tax=Arundo donax TaxID=35708 RepID=A0A0A9GLZ1_ARUDO
MEEFLKHSTNLGGTRWHCYYLINRHSNSCGRGLEPRWFGRISTPSSVPYRRISYSIISVRIAVADILFQREMHNCSA